MFPILHNSYYTGLIDCQYQKNGIHRIDTISTYINLMSSFFIDPISGLLSLFSILNPWTRRYSINFDPLHRSWEIWIEWKFVLNIDITRWWMLLEHFEFCTRKRLKMAFQLLFRNSSCIFDFLKHVIKLKLKNQTIISSNRPHNWEYLHSLHPRIVKGWSKRMLLHSGRASYSWKLPLHPRSQVRVAKSVSCQNGVIDRISQRILLI